MVFRRYLAIPLLGLWLFNLVSCINQPENGQTETQQITPSITLTSISTIKPTLQKTIVTPKLDITIIPSVTPILVYPIIAENLDRLEFIDKYRINADFGREVKGLAISADSKFLAIGMNSGIVIWDLISNKQVKTIKVKTSFVEFSPDGKYLGFAEHLRFGIINLETLEIEQDFSRPGYGNISSNLRFFSDGIRYIVDGKPTEIRSISDGTIITSFVSGAAFNMELSPDGSYLALGSYFEPKMRIYDSSDWTLTKLLKCPGSGMTNVAISHDSKLVACTSYSGSEEIIIYSATTWEKSTTINLIQNVNHPNIPINSLVFSPDDKYITDGYIFYPTDPNQDPFPIPLLNDWRNTVIVSPDGNTLVAMVDSIQITIYRIGKGQTTFVYPHNGEVIDKKKSYEFKINPQPSWTRIWWSFDQDGKNILKGFGGQSIVKIEETDPNHILFIHGYLWVNVWYVENNTQKRKTILVNID
jgi:hypothetical protein